MTRRPTSPRRIPDPRIPGNDDDPSVRSVIVVANRLPLHWSDADGWRQAPGGLVTALSDVVDTSLEWVGSAATLEHPTGDVPSSCVGAIRAVTLDRDVVEGATNGMANGVLWPALHGMSERVRHRSSHWAAYRSYNDVFADTIIATAAEGRRVWIHDYHLFLVPHLVKAARPDLAIGVSIHTPFDASAMLRLSESAELAVGLADCDVIGVQTLADAHQLADFLGVAAIRATPEIIVSPASIDPGRTIASVAEPGAVAAMEEWRRRRRDRRLVVGVDRLDYTKAITERLVSYDLAFRRGTISPDDVQIVQIAQPTRTARAEYRELRIEVERLAHQLTAKWQREDRSPVLDIRFESLDRPQVLGLLSLADIAMVTPARDGMNLVAKEFSLLAEHSGGVLVLSNRAGAAAELGAGSILVDGARPESVCDGLAEALRLDTATRHRMAQSRAHQVRSWTSGDWSEAFLQRLDTAPLPGPTPSEVSRSRSAPSDAAQN